MALSDQYREFEQRLLALVEESTALGEKVAELERQTQVLLERLSRATMQDGGMEALRKLYDEGFHICHARFAQPREDDCLFCLSFLHNRGIDSEKLKLG